MALKEDYKDAVFAGLRKYKMLDNGDGTVSPVDMTEYENGGDKFGAKDVNAITKTVNATGEIIADDNDGFKPDQKYVIGDIVIYDNKTWRFKVDHEPGEWDESQVERTNILAVIAEQNKNFEVLNRKFESKKMELIWENDSPTSAFPEQTISIDLSGYYAIMIIGDGCVISKDHTKTTGASPLYPIGYSGQWLSSINYSGAAEGGIRVISVGKNGITFSEAYTSNSFVLDDTYGIPLKIYGIK